jgi:hypothetical protein
MAEDFSTKKKEEKELKHHEIEMRMKMVNE